MDLTNIHIRFAVGERAHAIADRVSYARYGQTSGIAERHYAAFAAQVAIDSGASDEDVETAARAAAREARKAYFAEQVSA